MNPTRFLFVISVVLLTPVALVSVSHAQAKGVPDVPFVQEYHQPFRVGASAVENDVRCIAIDGEGTVWTGTRSGVFHLIPNEDRWVPLQPPEQAGPVFDLCTGTDGSVWAATWNGLYRCSSGMVEKIEGIDAPISAVCAWEDSVVCLGPEGFWRVRGATVEPEPLQCSRNIRSILPDGEGGFWIATAMGLYHRSPSGVRLYQSDEEILTCDTTAVAYAHDGSLWVGGFGGVSVFRDEELFTTFTPEDGLPTVHVQCVTPGPDGTMWVGTTKGITRYDGKTWSLRHSRRWLLADDVRDVAFDREGTAWIATGAGVSAIRRKKMTLAEKADYFLEILYERHVREPWFVEKCYLETPGDLSTWRPEDDDNDGEYTGNYLVMESFRYAVTKNPEAKENARRAFHALRRLETINGIPGFVARTIIPATWDHMHDPNRNYTDREIAEHRVRDPRFKPVEVRWHPTPDGKWLWKGDTSSDEITGHFFAYQYYYDLAADESEKELVREQVRKIMDYIMENGYVLIGVDGTHTRWAVWSPEKLLRDPDWKAEQGINALEILSFLKTTFALTGDEKYRKAYLDLIEQHGYAELARRAKTFAKAWNTHIDDSLLVEAFPALLKYEADPKLVSIYRQSFDRWYEGIRNEQNPFFNFIYGSFSGGDPQIADSIFFLRDTPLDLINWTVDNSRREDLRVVRAPLLEVLSTNRLLPPSERGVVRWDKNPWQAIQGDDGRTEWAPTFWLMPYWIGRYYGFIQAP